MGRTTLPSREASPVVIDPAFNFGAPTVDGISTEVLAEMVDAGEPIEDVARDVDQARPDGRITTGLRR